MKLTPARNWYHGSPARLTTLRQGSTITQGQELARIVSRKPAIVSVLDDGRIKHDGVQTGYLHTIADDIREGDVTPHPRTTMAPGDEWLTTRQRVERGAAFGMELPGRPHMALRVRGKKQQYGPSNTWVPKC